MEIQRLEAEINQTKSQLVLLENRLKEMQQQCEHQFEEGPNYKKCTKCNKAEALYY